MYKRQLGHRPHLRRISAASHPHLGCISPASRLHLGRYVDDSVTDRTYAYILITAKDGSNLIDDPGKYLQAMLTVVQHAYTNASVTATDSSGHSLTLDWKDFCYSVHHPSLTAPIHMHPMHACTCASLMCMACTCACR